MKEIPTWQRRDEQLREEIALLLARCTHLEDQIDAFMTTNPLVRGKDAVAPLYVPTDW